MLEISKEFMFEASHILPKHPGKCSRLHGHSWKLKVAVVGEVNKETGFVMDYAVLKSIVQAYIIDHVDHAHLGCGNVYMFDTYPLADAVYGTDFYPSSENLVKKFVDILNQAFDEKGVSSEIELAEVTLYETCTSQCTWRYDRE